MALPLYACVIVIRKIAEFHIDRYTRFILGCTVGFLKNVPIENYGKNIGKEVSFPTAGGV